VTAWESLTVIVSSKTNKSVSLYIFCKLRILCYLSFYYRGRDRMAVGFTTTCAIITYHH